MEIVDCPTCGAPAEAESWSIGSAAGPVAHVKLLCVRRHWYLMPREMLTNLSGQAGRDGARETRTVLPHHPVGPT